MKRATRIRLFVYVPLLLGLVVLLKWVVQLSVVLGESMTPTLRPWDLCLLRRVSDYQPHRGQVVMFRTADDPPLYLVKRVIGLPGETIAGDQGRVLVNGVLLDEPYTAPAPGWQLPATVVPAGKIYVIGDNRGQQGGETWHGLVATRLVTGRLLWHLRWRKQ